MSNNPRDTKFLGFATLLLAEFTNTDGYDLHEVEKLVARRAYDLVQHTLGQWNGLAGHPIVPADWTHVVDDLTEWPESEAKA